MSGVRSIFDIGKSALSANELALQTLSHNIANVDTPGYSREETVLQTATPEPSAVGMLGNGVRVTEGTKVRRQLSERHHKKEEHRPAVPEDLRTVSRSDGKYSE